MAILCEEKGIGYLAYIFMTFVCLLGVSEICSGRDVWKNFDIWIAFLGGVAGIILILSLVGDRKKKIRLNSGIVSVWISRWRFGRLILRDERMVSPKFTVVIEEEEISEKRQNGLYNIYLNAGNGKRIHLLRCKQPIGDPWIEGKRLDLETVVKSDLKLKDMQDGEN